MTDGVCLLEVAGLGGLFVEPADLDAKAKAVEADLVKGGDTERSVDRFGSELVIGLNPVDTPLAPIPLMSTIARLCCKV